MATQSVPPPHQVDGFASARVQGLLPHVPEEPPALVPGPSAHRAQNNWLVAVGTSFLAWVLFASLLGRVTAGLPAVVGPALFVLCGVGVFFWVFVRLRSRIGEAYLRELAAGYTTLPLRAGGFWVAPRGLGANYQAPWDYRGLWVMDPMGRVVSAPDRSVAPPGMYPSPERPGMLQLWTGRVWSRRFETPARPFLTSPPAQP